MKAVSLLLLAAATLPACGRTEGRARREGVAPVEAPAAASLAAASGAPSAAPSVPASAAPSVPASAHPAASASARPPRPTAAAPDDGRPRVYAKSRFVWVRETPSSQYQWIGYLWIGGSVPIRDPKHVSGPGCRGFWIAIEPKGFVCVDDDGATLNASDPAYQAVLPYAPQLEAAWPHRYAESRGAEKYSALPDAKAQRKREWDLVQQRERIEQAQASDERRHKLLKGVDLTPATEPPPTFPPLPRFINEPRDRLNLNSTVAYSKEFRFGERDWLLAADMTWVPKDRVAPYPKVTFQGVRISDGLKTPIGFFRDGNRPRWRRTDGGFKDTGKTFERLARVTLTGQEATHDKQRYLEVTGGDWVKADDIVVPTPATKTPWGAPVNGDDTTGKTPKGRGTWLEISVLGGWLIAYEGTRPVYATMMSPGRGGVPVPGKKPISTASTPTGFFKITGKFATATMAAPYEFIHSEVPWTQNFSGPHAIHGAYWHNDWGQKKSAGCVNVSPRDGRFLHFFTEPAVPPGWHGVRWDPKAEPATSVVVHR